MKVKDPFLIRKKIDIMMNFDSKGDYPEEEGAHTLKKRAPPRREEKVLRNQP